MSSFLAAIRSECGVSVEESADLAGNDAVGRAG